MVWKFSPQILFQIVLIQSVRRHNITNSRHVEAETAPWTSVGQPKVEKSKAPADLTVQKEPDVGQACRLYGFNEQDVVGNKGEFRR